MEPTIYLKIGKNGEEFNIADKIPKLTYLGSADASSSPQFTNNYEDLSGTDGSHFLSQTFAKRTFTENFCLYFSDYYDFSLLRHKIYALFGEREKIRVRSDAHPSKVYFGYVTPFDISPAEQGANYANFSISFDVPNGYRYSLYRSDSKNFETTDGWDLDMNYPTNEVQPHYHYTTTSFKIYNASDIQINPNEQRHDLKIICKFTGPWMQITNKTNKTEWKYNVSSDGTQSIIIDQLNTTLDGENATGKTDCNYITLEKGWNDIEVTGATSSDITFSFPFIYLQ